MNILKKTCILPLSLFFIFIFFNHSYSKTGSPRIVGGKEALEGKWSWMAALTTKGLSPYDGQFCGGSLIGKEWVLTAAHCLTTETTESMDVILGIHDLVNDTDYKRVAIDKIYISPAYETGLDNSIDGDIAIIKLKTPVSLYQPIPLNQDTSLSAPQVMSTIIGWGLLSNIGPAAEKLQEVQLPIVSNAIVDSSGIYATKLKEDALAAGLPQGGQDSCQGDSGGPLMVPNIFATGYEIAGIVSYGPDGGCAIPNGYGVYSKVSYYYDTIKSITDLDYLDSNHFRIKSALASDDNKNQSGSYFEDYIYKAPSTSKNFTLQIYVQEGNFSPKLQISDYNTGEIISSASSDTDELTISFNPENQKKYRFRVSSKNLGKTGTFDFNAPKIEIGKRATRLIYDSQIEAELTIEDLSDDAAENLYYDDYIIKDLKEDSLVKIVVTPDSSTMGFYPNIIVTKQGEDSPIKWVYDGKIPAEVDFKAEKGERYTISVEAVSGFAPGKYSLKVTGLGENDSMEPQTSTDSSGSSCFIESITKNKGTYRLLIFLTISSIILFYFKKKRWIRRN